MKNMKKELDYLMKIRYLYMISKERNNIGIINSDMEFKNKYYKDKEAWKKKFIGIK